MQSKHKMLKILFCTFLHYLFLMNMRRKKDIKISFTTNIGRNVPYYSNMVFNIQVKTKGKIQTFLSGGRYNRLVKNLGSKKNVSAVGAAIDLNLL